jgi:DNA replication protein DnaC
VQVDGMSIGQAAREFGLLALGNSGTGKTHIGLVLRPAACQQGFRVRFTTAGVAGARTDQGAG